ncbi:uncharacterized protein BDW47DRAFT_129569 [Aspergillus candidus]|uniref:NWD NACHT-NTPase N-terminal domain-containing protein n=1 Tax=Aspergillus candidus TaxID=41067 RepID=A0A2I2EZT7_ASPCN|nr:hypothetical protein BDW47DRAFT_129569 [Aspergillus candidus]PLB33880.1 hypothetical protein BDW47DRAFT_129569 [Aspergillus candidus]
MEFRGLWEEAYEKLRKDEGKLIEKYEKYLLASKNNDQSEKTGEHWAQVRFEIRDLADQKIKEIGDKQVLLRVGGEMEVAKAAGRDVAQRIVHGIMRTKDVISAAIVNEPHAALVWAGVLVVLPVLLNLVLQDEKAIQGLNTISELVIRCHYMEESLFKYVRISTRESLMLIP